MLSRKGAGRLLLIMACLSAASCLLSLVFGVERGFESEMEFTISEASGDTFEVRLSEALPPAFVAEEMAAIRERIPSARDVAACSRPTVSFHDVEKLVVPHVQFVTSNYFSVRGLKITLGRSFTSLEEELRIPVAVAGARLIESGMAKIGEVYRCPVTGLDYQVIGALAPQQSDSLSSSIDEATLYVPFSLFDPDKMRQTAYSNLHTRISLFRFKHVDIVYPRVEFWVRSKPGMAEKAAAEAETLFSSYLGSGEKVFILPDTISQLVYSKVKEHATGGLLTAGLAVLGVAVMNCTNLLLLDVVSLRRKIGIKRCVGAARIDIALETLGRTASLTVCGVAVGLGLAFSVRGLFQGWFGEAVILDLGSTWKVAAVVISAMALAGLYPAIVSSSLPPVQAVRSDYAWKPSKKNKSLDVRQALAIAAVAIGVAGIVIMTGSSYLTKEKVESYLRAVGERLVIIENPDTDSAPIAVSLTETMPPGQSNPPLTLYPTLADNLPGATGAYRGAWFQDIVSTVALPGSDQVYTASIVACSPGFAAMRRFQMASGRFLQHQDDQHAVCVLGHRIAKSLFGEEDCLGKTVQLGSPVPFTVIGVLKPRPQGVLDLSFNREDSVFIPPMSMLQVPDLANQFCENSKIMLEAREGDDPQSLIKRASDYFAREYPLFAPPRIDKYLRSVEKMDEIRAKIAKVFRLTGVLAMALSAVGVFTIMTAKVTERARDIAIRRAVGASKGDITRLYLSEAVRICLAGSIVGFAIALPILRALEPLVPLTLEAAFTLAAWAAGGGLVAAVAGGLHPARTAASKPPAQVFRVIL